MVLSNDPFSLDTTTPAWTVQHRFRRPGYALLNWFQGLIAAILPAHERAKTGCAYGMMQKSFAPQVNVGWAKLTVFDPFSGVGGEC